MKKIIIIIFMCITICGCTNSSVELPQSSLISCETKDALMNEKENVVLIDVRTPEEFNEGHLENAINIEYDSIVETLKNNDSITFDTHIIVYCRSGNRSSIAHEALYNVGYKNTYDLGAMSNCV